MGLCRSVRQTIKHGVSIVIDILIAFIAIPGFFAAMCVTMILTLKLGFYFGDVR
jgi:hypothetical protein